MAPDKDYLTKWHNTTTDYEQKTRHMDETNETKDRQSGDGGNVSETIGGEKFNNLKIHRKQVMT